jgi:HEAT repeat protein
LLRAAARGVVAIDHRFLRAILERGEAELGSILRFFEAESRDGRIDTDADLLAIVRQCHTAATLPFLVEFARRDRFQFSEALTGAFVELGAASVEPLLNLFEESDNAEDVAFALAALHLRDPRVLSVLTGLLDIDPIEGALCLGICGDPAARPALEAALAKTPPDEDLAREGLTLAIQEIEGAAPPEEAAPYDIWPDYPEEAEPHFAALDDQELVEFLSSPLAVYRAHAVLLLGTNGLEGDVLARILELAKSDPDAGVRGACWEALDGSLEQPGVRKAMLARLQDPAAPIEERCGALVALALESGEVEAVVRRSILEFYTIPEARAQAIKAMWHSMDRRFAQYIPPHLDDPDLEIRRQVVCAVGWLGLAPQLGRIEPLFEDEDLRDDALCAYALAAPGSVTPARTRALLRKIDDLAGGLSRDEGILVRKALDNRLQLHGQDPIFLALEDSKEEDEPEPPARSTKVGRNAPCPCGSGKKYKKCCGK